MDHTHGKSQDVAFWLIELMTLKCFSRKEMSILTSKANIFEELHWVSGIFRRVPVYFVSQKRKCLIA